RKYSAAGEELVSQFVCEGAGRARSLTLGVMRPSPMWGIGWRLRLPRCHPVPRAVFIGRAYNLRRVAVVDPAVIISGLALVVSAFALGWNVYRDVILRARVRVHVAVVSLVTPGESTESVPRFIRIEATNHGPGPVEITNIGGKAASLRR